MKSARHLEPGCSVAVYSCMMNDLNEARREIEHEKYYVSLERSKEARSILVKYPNTNNVSEYYAMWKGLQTAVRLLEEGHFARVVLYADSQLTVNQLNGVFHVNGNSALREWYDLSFNMAQKLKNKLQICWISRKATYSILGH